MGFSSLVIAGASQFVALQLMLDGVPGAIVVDWAGPRALCARPAPT